jgi:3alpha(or 20beta)-hydroxysteroid dehydrogenase
MERLSGKVAIVTGAARGQGAEEARRIVEEGGRVVLTDVLADELHATADALGDAATCLVHDVADEGAWTAVVEHAVDRHGGVDALVNNAAIHRVTPIEDETLAGFQRMLSVNLTGTFLGIRAVVAPMRDRGGGSIVNVSSLAGMTGIWGHGAYGASKWGVRGLTKTAATELGPFGIRVNSIHPGPIDTAMLPPGGEKSVVDVPLQRIGTARDVAELVVYLASDESSFVSGAEITVDGGMGAGRVGRRSGPAQSAST